MSNSTARAVSQSDRHRTLAVGFSSGRFPIHIEASLSFGWPASSIVPFPITLRSPRDSTGSSVARRVAMRYWETNKEIWKGRQAEASVECASKKRSIAYGALSMICFWTKFFCFEVVSLQFYTGVYIHVFMSWGHAILFGVHTYCTYIHTESIYVEGE